MNIQLSMRLWGAFALLMVLLTACGANLQDEIIGQWEIKNEAQGAVMIFSFKEDNDLTIWVGDIPIEGSYTWLDENTIQITMTAEDQSQEILGKVKIEGDQLIITNEKGETETLTRVEE